MLIRKVRILPVAFIAIAAFGITLLLSQMPFFTVLELKGLDLLFILRGPLPPPESVIIVAIDEASMAEIGQQWPWPRSLHAQLIQKLKQAGARAIGFDILFSEPSQAAEDQAFARAVQESGNVVLVSALAAVDDPMFRHTLRVDPMPLLRDVATVGNPFVGIDRDGVVRRARLLAPDMPSFALQVVRRALQHSPQSEHATLPLARQLKPIDFLQEHLINYQGPPKTIKAVSYYQALQFERMLPPGLFADKIVLVGRWLEAIPEPQRLSGDMFLTPFSWVNGEAAAGVEIQAEIIADLLAERFLTEPAPLERGLLLLALALLTGLLLAWINPVAATLASVLIAALCVAWAEWLFARLGLCLPVVAALVIVALVHGGLLLLRALSAERERRQLLEEVNRDLEDKIAARTQELSSANQELQQRHQQIETAYQELGRTQQQLTQSEKMASLGLLVAGVAHELNNPISYVHSNLDLIEDYTERLAAALDGRNPAADPGKIRATLHELITSCRDGTTRVKKIVLDLRTFSRTDDTGLVLADLHEGLESTLNLLEAQYRGRISVHRAYGGLPRVECYPGQINQIFMNLLQNAAQAIPGQGEVWIRTCTVTPGERVRIAIRDNGVGIAEEHMNRLFDPFFTTKAVGAGTGLGLSISYGIAQKHGGKIEVTRCLDRGSEFTLELPIRQPRGAS